MRGWCNKKLTSDSFKLILISPLSGYNAIVNCFVGLLEIALDLMSNREVLHVQVKHVNGGM